MFHSTLQQMADGKRVLPSAYRTWPSAEGKRGALMVLVPWCSPNGQEMPTVCGHQVIGTGGHRTLKDSVVGVTSRSHSRESRRDNHGGGVLNGPNYLCGAFPIPANLPVSTSATSSRMKSERKNSNLPRRASSSANRSLPGNSGRR